MANMDDFLSGTFGDVADRFVIPSGEYVFTIGPNWELGENSNGNRYLQWNLQATSSVSFRNEEDAVEDEDLVNAIGVRHQVWLTDKSLIFAKEMFRDVLGLDTDSTSRRELFEQAVGLEVRARGSREVAQSGKPYFNIDGFLMPVE